MNKVENGSKPPQDNEQLSQKALERMLANPLTIPVELIDALPKDMGEQLRTLRRQALDEKDQKAADESIELNRTRPKEVYRKGKAR